MLQLNRRSVINVNEKEVIRGNAEKVKLVPAVLICLGLFLGVFVSYLITVPYSEDYMLPVTIGGGSILIIAGIIMWLYVKNCEIVVTNKRIYGKAAFGNRVDIPLDSVTAVGIIGWLKGISVSSSSGFIKFLYISNYNEIHKKISDIIMSRTSISRNDSSQADELKKYKELLDNGVISQEEFNAKKKQLLDL